MELNNQKLKYLLEALEESNRQQSLFPQDMQESTRINDINKEKRDLENLLKKHLENNAKEVIYCTNGDIYTIFEDKKDLKKFKQFVFEYYKKHLLKDLKKKDGYPDTFEDYMSNAFRIFLQQNDYYISPVQFKDLKKDLEYAQAVVENKPWTQDKEFDHNRDALKTLIWMCRKNKEIKFKKRLM